MAASFSTARFETSREFSPASMMAAPTTASCPSTVAAPMREALPTETRATSPTVTAGPRPAGRSGIPAISWAVRTRVSARTVKASPPSVTTPPPAFSVLRRTALSSSDMGTPDLASLARSGSTSIWRSCPPMTLTSASPGVERSAGRTRVSCNRRKSRRRVDSSAGALASAA